MATGHPPICTAPVVHGMVYTQRLSSRPSAPSPLAIVMQVCATAVEILLAFWPLTCACDMLTCAAAVRSALDGRSPARCAHSSTSLGSETMSKSDARRLRLVMLLWRMKYFCAWLATCARVQEVEPTSESRRQRRGEAHGG